MLLEQNGDKLYYEYRRPVSGDRTPLLMLHGWGCDHTYFRFFADALSSDMPVLIPDFPGHGQSPEPSRPWEISDFAEQIIALLDKLELEKVSIFAHSFGGRVAIYLAAKHPERVVSMAITGGAGLREPLSEKQKKKQKRYKSVQSMLNGLKKIPPLTSAVEKLQKKIRDRRSSPDYLQLSEGMKKTFVKVVNEDLAAYLPKISAPVLLLWGDGDTETPLWMGQTMEKQIPDAGLVILEGGTHFAFLEQKERCLAIIKSFWNAEA